MPKVQLGPQGGVASPRWHQTNEGKGGVVNSPSDLLVSDGERERHVPSPDLIFPHQLLGDDPYRVLGILHMCSRVIGFLTRLAWVLLEKPRRKVALSLAFGVWDEPPDCFLLGYL